jgi:hypothetical protein
MNPKDEAKEKVYRHCGGGLSSIDDYNDNHWKCGGDGSDGQCSCACHAISSESRRRTLAEVKEMVEERRENGCNGYGNEACTDILDRINEMMEKPLILNQEDMSG